jgi:HlyD family secretion protein
MAISARHTRRIVGWTIGGIAIAALLVAAFRPRAVDVETAEVARRPLQVTVDHEGQTRVHDRYTVSAPVAGRVERIELEPGDPVVAGRTVVATFAPAPPPLLDARARAEAEAQVRAAEAAVAQARAALAQNDAQRALAETERTRAERLFEGAAISRAERDQAITAAQTTTEATRASRAAVTVAEHQLDVARAALMPAGPASTPATLVLRAPVTGVVLRRFHESAAVVGAGEPLVDIADPADLEVVADYLSSDAVTIRPGMPALLDRWGGSDALHGRVTRVEPFGFLKVSALGVEEQRVNVIIGLQNPASDWHALGDGYRVEVRVILWEGSRVLTVPTSALFRRGDDWAAFVVESGRARVKTVHVDHQTGLWTEVIDGVQEHDRVITHPPDAVADGVRVSARNASLN